MHGGILQAGEGNLTIHRVGGDGAGGGAGGGSGGSGEGVCMAQWPECNDAGECDNEALSCMEGYCKPEKVNSSLTV